MFITTPYFPLILQQLRLPELPGGTWILLGGCLLALLLLAIITAFTAFQYRSHLLPYLSAFTRPITRGGPIASTSSSTLAAAEPAATIVVPDNPAQPETASAPGPVEGETSPTEQAKTTPTERQRPLMPFWAPVLLGLLLLFCCITAPLSGVYLINQNNQRATGTAEAVVAGAATNTAEASITPELPTATPTSTPLPNPTSCAAIRRYNPDAADGDYTLYLDGQAEMPFTVYCHGMDSFPTEYLTLVNVDGPFNYSMISYPEGALTTHYQRLRFNPATFVVDTTDRTFATLLGEVPGYNVLPLDAAENYPVIAIDYARAESCNRGTPGAPPGQANIDLTGTGFTLDETVVFAFEGGDAQDSLSEISEDRQVVNLSISGRCAHIKPAGPLRLAYVLPDIATPETTPTPEPTP